MRHLKFHQASYYAWKQAKLTKPLAEEKKILEAIKDIHSHRHMKSYGSPRMTEELKSRGFQCGRHRVARLMREQGIFVRPRKAFRPCTAKVDTTARIAPNHLKEACAPNAPGQQLGLRYHLPTNKTGMIVSEHCYRSVFQIHCRLGSIRFFSCSKRGQSYQKSSQKRIDTKGMSLSL